MTERSSWADERMDDFVAHISTRFDQVDARFAEWIGGSIASRPDSTASPTT